MDSEILFSDIDVEKYNIVEKKELKKVLEENKNLKQKNEKLLKVIKFLNKEIEMQDEIIQSQTRVKYLSCLDCDLNNVFKKFFD
jgi:hypothetical protein